MKILIQKDGSNADDVKLLSYQLLEDSDSIKWEISEVEPLVEKEKHTVVYKWDKTNSKVIGEYVPIPKSETELLAEKLDSSVAELSMAIAMQSMGMPPTTP